MLPVARHYLKHRLKQHGLPKAEALRVFTTEVDGYRRFVDVFLSALLMYDARSLSEVVRQKSVWAQSSGGCRTASDRVVRRKRLARRGGCYELWVLNADCRMVLGQEDGSRDGGKIKVRVRKAP